jgi:hypothetical protein
LFLGIVFTLLCVAYFVDKSKCSTNSLRGVQTRRVEI